MKPAGDPARRSALTAALVPAEPPVDRLDHDDYAHRASLRAASPAWPGGRPAAAFVLIHVEALELDPPADAVREPRLRGDFGSFRPELRAHSLFEYGLRIGVFRLLDLLQQRGWRVAAAVNGLVATEKPALLRMLVARDVELLAGGWSASRMVTGAMPRDEEAQLLERTIAAIAAATGRRPTGYASQDYGHSRHTAGVLAAAGIDHAVDWPNDEKPFAWGPERRLVMLPAAGELDDVQAMQARRLQPRDWAGALDAALRWWGEEAAVGSVFALPLHAATAGAAHRAQALARVLHGCDATGFWQAPPSVVAAAWRRQSVGGDQDG